MDNHLNAFLRAVLEAATEFLPVSSTGHLFFFSYFFPFQGFGDLAAQFEDLFDIFIQSGAILSVLFLYYKKFYSMGTQAFGYIRGDQAKKEGFLFYQNLAIGILPILALGFLAKSWLDQIKERGDLLFIIGSAWLIGGVFMVAVEVFQSKKEEKASELPTPRQALWIGLFQCLALVPGVSRSAATIISARWFGLNKKDSAEFSFFLAVPVLLLAGAYKLVKHRQILNSETLAILVFGSLVSFILCIFVIKLFLSFLKHRSFISFGMYRIILGLLTILYYFQNTQKS